MNYKLAFYQPGDLSIIDLCDNETLKSQCFGQTIEDIRIRYPEAVVVPFIWAVEQINETAKETYKLLCPMEITEEKWWDMLEVLPPLDYTITDEGQSFKISERTFGDITACYVKKNEKYYTVMARLKTPHDKLLAVCE